ncbi:MAG: putative hydrolase [Terrestrivirus sp.]|uniref:Putative hydrolase n=1 Tax=Terrestrivirus sp. TaxID=2487775 RepID=A0A3G4ZNR3_9VIRU|nr:MAG: putative hydrolase [Terrestrivirus sp.]
MTELSNKENKDQITILSKKKVKYLYHFADIHIPRSDDNNEYSDAFKRVKEKLQSDKKRNALIVLVGDIISYRDNLSISGITQLYQLLKMLSSIHPVIIIPGNHDVNTKNKLDADLIESIYKDISYKNQIYYLRDTGLYQYGNFVFSICSIFDKRLIPSAMIPDDYTKICLYHGFVYDDSKKLKYMKFHSYKKIDEFNGYDLVLLGDIHENIFINDHVAYSSSLVRQDKTEIGRHGFIRWTIDNKKISSQFIELESDFEYITAHVIDNKLTNESEKLLNDNKNKKIYLDVKYKNTHINIVDGVINKIKQGNNIVLTPIRPEEIIDSNTQIFKMKNIIDKNDQKALFDLIIDAINKTYKLTEDEINYLKKIHENAYIESYKNIKEKSKSNIKLLTLSFKNVFCYKSINLIDFAKLANVIGIVADNQMGKTSIFDILLYGMFDKTSKGEISHKQILNNNSSDFEIVLTLEVNNVKYIIKKSYNKKNKDREIVIHEIDDKGKSNNITGSTVKKSIDKIKSIMGITYDDFLSVCYMSQNNIDNIIDMKNSERKELLYKQLNLHIFDELHNKISEPLKNIKNELLKQNTKIDEKNKTYCDVKNVTQSDIDLFDNEIYKIDNILSECTKKKNLLEEKLKIDVHSLKKDYEECEKQLDTKIDKHSELEKEIIKMQDKIHEMRLDEHTVEQKQATLKHFSNFVHDKITNIIKDNVNKKEQNKILFEIDKLHNDCIHDDLLLKIYNEQGDYREQELLKLVEQKSKLAIECEKLDNEIRCDIKLLATISDKITEYESDINSNEHKKLQNREADLKNKYNDLIEKRQKIKSSYETKLKLEKDFNELTKEKCAIEKHKTLIEMYEATTGSNGISFTLAQDYCKDINAQINNILSKYCDIKISLELESEEKKINKVVSLYRTDTTRIQSSGLCGYERFAINLSTKIYFSNTGTVHVNSFFIDEALACIDRNKFKNIQYIIKYIKSLYDTIFVISHDNRIQELYDSELRIKRHNHESTLLT